MSPAASALAFLALVAPACGGKAPAAAEPGPAPPPVAPAGAADDALPFTDAADDGGDYFAGACPGGQPAEALCACATATDVADSCRLDHFDGGAGWQVALLEAPYTLYYLVRRDGDRFQFVAELFDTTHREGDFDRTYAPQRITARELRGAFIVEALAELTSPNSEAPDGIKRWTMTTVCVVRDGAPTPCLELLDDVTWTITDDGVLEVTESPWDLPYEGRYRLVPSR